MFKKKFGYGLVELFLIILLTGVVIFVCFGVFTRYVLNESMRWVGELSRFIYIWITFLGAYVVMKNNGHVAVNTFIEYLPDKISNKIKNINNILIIIFLIVLFIGGWQVSKTAMFQVAPGTGIRVGYIYIVIPISALLMIYHLIRKLIGK